MKIYTRQGDKGTTSLCNGERVLKCDRRVETYGSIDELSAFVGVLYDSPDMMAEHKDELLRIQNILFVIESHFASGDSETQIKFIPVTKAEDLTYIESCIDKIESQLPPMTNFVIAGGNLTASHCHVCRTVCRRAERNAVCMAQTAEVGEIDLKLLNRLSDYFFVLARLITIRATGTENVWEPNC